MIQVRWLNLTGFQMPKCPSSKYKSHHDKQTHSFLWHTPHTDDTEWTAVFLPRSDALTARGKVWLDDSRMKMLFRVQGEGRPLFVLSHIKERLRCDRWVLRERCSTGAAEVHPLIWFPLAERRRALALRPRSLPDSLVQLTWKSEPKAQLQTKAQVGAPAGGVCRARRRED